MIFRKQLKLKKLWLACSIAFSCFLISLLLLVMQGVTSLDSKVENHLKLTAKSIERILEVNDRLLDQIVEISTYNCTELRPILMDYIVKNPASKTISITHNGIVVCSTYDELLNVSSAFTEEPDNQLMLANAKEDVLGKSIGVIKKTKGEYASYITIRLDILFSLLNFVDTSGIYHVQSLDRWVSEEGTVYDGEADYNLIYHSEYYDFNVNAYIPTSSYFHEIMMSSRWIILLLAGFSLVVGRYVFLYSGKNDSLSAMQHSLKKNEFTPYAQPIMNAKGELIGLEILMRWHNDELGLIYPDVFIPLAERSGLIVPMTSQLISNTIDVFEKHQASLPKGFHIGINICAQHLEKANHATLLASCIEFQRSTLNEHAHLVLELTERGIIDDYGEAREFFEQLQSMGIKMAMDDFGTGNASLSAIHNLNFDFIKVDKSFIDLIGSDAVSAPLVDNIIDLAKRLEVDLIAEGVEEKEQLDYLIEHDVAFIQGYYYGKPIPLSDFIETYIQPKHSS